MSLFFWERYFKGFFVSAMLKRQFDPDEEVWQQCGVKPLVISHLSSLKMNLNFCHGFHFRNLCFFQWDSRKQKSLSQEKKQGQQCLVSCAGGPGDRDGSCRSVALRPASSASPGHLLEWQNPGLHSGASNVTERLRMWMCRRMQEALAQRIFWVEIGCGVRQQLQPRFIF